MILDPAYLISNDDLVDNAAFGTNDTLWSVVDPTAAYSTPCGEHDMVMSITRSAGSVDVSGTIGYYVEAAP